MNISEAKAKLQKTNDYFLSEIVKVRGSRANPQLIEDIKVDVYGSILPIKQLGTVNVVDSTLITVQCWDKNNVDAIKSAISDSDLNVVPSADGSLVRIPLPSLTEERREELVKVIKRIAEEAKVSARKIRRNFLDSLKDDSVSEDEVDRGKKEIQKEMKNFNTEIDKEFENKEQELMTI
jgi:ribosome recycling factor